MQYLHKRNEIYYFRVAIPLNMKPFFDNQKEIKISLGTTNLTRAKRLVKIYAKRFYVLKKAIFMGLNKTIIQSLVDSFIQKKLSKSIYEHSVFDRELDLDGVISLKNASKTI